MFWNMVAGALSVAPQVVHGQPHCRSIWTDALDRLHLIRGSVVQEQLPTGRLDTTLSHHGISIPEVCLGGGGLRLMLYLFSIERTSSVFDAILSFSL